MKTSRKDTHCSYCGHPFAELQTWPRVCRNCRNETFANPAPVVIMLVPVDEGLLLIRRSDEPHKGKLALPGGYVDRGESWQQAGAREVWEEAHVKIEPATIREYVVCSTRSGDLVLIFGLANLLTAAQLLPFKPNNETSERLVAAAPVELAFAIHTEVMKDYFSRPRGREDVQIKAGQVSFEILAHFNCPHCAKWWSIGDPGRERKIWYCPWCGKPGVFEAE